MQVTEMLAQVGGLKSMAHELGVSEADAQRGIDALMPAILGGIRKQAQGQQADGLTGLGGLLGKLGGGGLLDEVLAPAPTNVNHGNDVLGEIFGSKDVSRAVAQQASGTSGLDPALLRKMLPLVAMLVTGFMAKRASTDAATDQDAPAGGLGSVLGGLLGGKGAADGGGGMGGLMAMLDADGDGNPLDDIIRMMGK
jgi:hypothetical protein